MFGSPLRWFRDEDGDWTTPEGRRGEFVVLLIGLPALAFFTHAGEGLPYPTENPLAVAVGVCCGLLYATDYLSPLVERLPDGVGKWTFVSVFGGGFGLSVLELIHLTAPTVLFIFAAGGTILTIYTFRGLSPVHDGFQPPKRGVEPPPAIDSANSRPER